jgi:hypothetical protein
MGMTFATRFYRLTLNKATPCLRHRLRSILIYISCVMIGPTACEKRFEKQGQLL